MKNSTPDSNLPQPNLSKSEQAYQWLRHKIRSQEYEPGHRLVLSTIADELNVSVVPIREAIRQLEAEGLVDYEHNIGAKVSVMSQEAYFETMETVAVLEGRATALSMPHLTPSDLARAKELNEKMEALLSDFDPEMFTELNKKFHRSLFYQCPNSRLIELLYAEWDRLDYFRVSTFNYVPERAKTSVKEHYQLIALIETAVEQEYLEKKARDHRLRTSSSYRAQIEQ